MEFNRYLIGNPFGTLLNITFPKAKDGITALGKIRLLGPIKPYSLFLSMVKGLELVRIAVPVIAVKLDDCIVIREISINCKFVSNQFLGAIGQTKRIKDSITLALQVIGVKSLLHSVHSTQHFVALRIIVTTRERTIGNIVILITRRRPFESLITYLANVLNFVSPLPFIKAGHTTKMMLVFFEPGLREIKLSVTPFALNIFAGAPLGTSGNLATIWGAILFAGIKEWLKFFSTNLTRTWLVLTRRYPLAFARTIDSVTIFNMSTHRPKLSITNWAISIFTTAALGIGFVFGLSLTGAIAGTKTLSIFPILIKEGTSAIFANFSTRGVWHNRTIVA